MRDSSGQPSQRERESLLALRSTVPALSFCLGNKGAGQSLVEESLMEEGNKLIFKLQL